MNKRNKDRLDQYIKKSVLLDPTEQFDWNSPPDSVFENAISEVNAIKVKKRRRVLWMFFSVFAFVKPH